MIRPHYLVLAAFALTFFIGCQTTLGKRIYHDGKTIAGRLIDIGERRVIRQLDKLEK